VTTALNIITDALQENGIVGAGQTPSNEDISLCLRRLNQILERWSNQRLAFPVLSEVSVTLNGAASYTIGPSGADVTAARPIRVTHATHIGTDSIESPIRVLTQEQWDAIPLKSIDGGPPDSIWYSASVTTGRVYVWPKGDSGTLKLDVLSLLTSFATQATTCTLPPGYESALYLTLACDTRGAYSLPPDADLRARAKGACSVLKRTNYEPVYLNIEQAGENSGMIERGF
jgi:hypothetical protein